jgi:hypothetical protein
MINIRLPNITEQTDRGKLEQIRSYLYQLAGELNWALGNIDSQADEAKQKIEATKEQNNAVALAQATFSEVKSLIIKSADIVNAYYEEISRRLEGVYVAQSDFGTYKQETAVTLDANSEHINLLFDNQQTLQENVDGVEEDVEGINGVLKTDAEGTTIIGSEAWCKIGVLDYEDSGFPIYGMEIGQVNTENEETVYKKFAQYRSDGVHLFDQNGIEVATISDFKLRITNAEIITAKITDSLKLGGYAISTNNGLAFKWEGR